jgi:hypothetical protein
MCTRLFEPNRIDLFVIPITFCGKWLSRSWAETNSRVGARSEFEVFNLPEGFWNVLIGLRREPLNQVHNAASFRS